MIATKNYNKKTIIITSFSKKAVISSSLPSWRDEALKAAAYFTHSDIT